MLPFFIVFCVILNFAQPKTFAISKLDMSTLTVNAVTVFEGVMAGKVKATVVDRDGNALKPAQ